MAIVADHPADRAQQLILLTDQLTLLIERETKLIAAREPPLSGEAGEEKARLANLYRQEMVRISAEQSLINTAPAPLREKLRLSTVRFRAALDAHGLALAAIKEVTEGLARALAEEVAKVQAGPRGYGAGGSYTATPQSAGAAVALNKTA